MDSSNAARPGRSHVQMFAAVGGAPVWWRLLGGNNRELGRGSVPFDDLETCALGVKNLQAVAGRLQPSIHRAVGGGWRWQLALDDLIVAGSGHRYDRLIRCRQAVTGFAPQFEAASIGATVMLTQSRRWATPAGRPLAGRPGQS